MFPRSIRSPASGSWSKTMPSCRRVVELPHDPRLQVAVEDVVERERLLLALEQGHRDGLVRVQLVLDPLVGVEARHDGGHDEPECEQPGPDRASARGRLLVLVAALRRVGRGRRSARDRGRRRIRDSRACEDCRGCLGGRVGDGQARGHASELRVHLLGGLEALARILCQGAQDDEVEVLGDVRSLRGRRLRDCRDVLHRDLDRGVAGERDRAGEHLVEHDADRVEVGALVDGSPARLLRREVLRGADDRAGLGHLARPRPRDAEVGHLQAAVGVHEHVVRLDVPVDDPLLVGEAHGAEDLPDVRDRPVDRQRAAGDDQLLERAPLDVLHRDVVGALGLAAVVDRDDVGMRERGGVLGLAAEALDELLVGRVLLVQDLDRDPPAELLVLGQVDVRHPARAEPPDHAVAPVEEGVDQGVLDGHGPSDFKG